MLDSPAGLVPLAAEDILSLAERAYRRLRDAIVDGSLPGGERISERSLAQTLGISAQPVREALRRLEAEGMVVTLPRRGTLVAEFGPRRLAEMGLIRIALEGTAASLAARQAGAEDIAALLGLLRAMRPLLQGNDIAALAEANERFHGRIEGLTGNSFLQRSLEALRAYDHFGRLRALRSTPQEPRRAWREHAAILSAIRRRDPERAEARMRAHVRRSLEASGILDAFNT
ncbi:GntR family transcriptional regulator [Teichococcus vastitatis]|jgi:DNA-binding GntR family transcriptional regulator|uniref:GntR family transcriptional regulator n=1 Tax=Teichococcus vastitatis TaxID=2307076 RepID=A0ABS9W1C4_9PROT|nr:GntR family transcriptional regulator [Pseudoroseomonas vastitatis]MCI0753096.1 GntR family transcriptional regulator [Pseudoroseomonas vastitatis]